MYHHFQSLGFEVKPIVGNLELENESLRECNHVWLWVKVGDGYQAYDWGKPCFDEQHYYGYFVSYETLIKAIGADLD